MPSSKAASRARPAPFSVRFPPDLQREVEADAERRGVSRNDWLAEAARRRLHPPTTARTRGGCEGGDHPPAALMSKPGGKKVCRLCGETVKP